MTRPTTNLAAAVRQRLQNVAKVCDRPFQEVLEYYAMERFLYRPTPSPYAGRFVLKGALLFQAWGGLESRSTRDIDFLARMENSVAAVIPVFRDVCRQDVEPDGMIYDPATVFHRPSPLVLGAPVVKARLAHDAEERRATSLLVAPFLGLGSRRWESLNQDLTFRCIDVYCLYLCISYVILLPPIYWRTPRELNASVN